MRVTNCFALAAQEVHLVQEARHSVQLNQIHDVVLFCKSLESHFELFVLVDAAFAELGLAAAAEQTTAESAQSFLD